MCRSHLPWPKTCNEYPTPASCVTPRRVRCDMWEALQSHTPKETVGEQHIPHLKNRYRSPLMSDQLENDRYANIPSAKFCIPRGHYTTLFFYQPGNDRFWGRRALFHFGSLNGEEWPLSVCGFVVSVSNRAYPIWSLLVISSTPQATSFQSLFWGHRLVSVSSHKLLCFVVFQKGARSGKRLLFVKYISGWGIPAGSFGRTRDSWSRGHEFKPHIGDRDYLK